jgi:hypothetical protein
LSEPCKFGSHPRLIKKSPWRIFDPNTSTIAIEPS